MRSRARTLRVFAEWSGGVLFPDVNVLVYAHRVESPDHVRCRAWLERLVASRGPFAFVDAWA